MQPLVAEEEKKDEYLKHSDLDAVMERIRREVTDSVKTAIAEVNARTDKEIAAAKGEIRGEMDAKLKQNLEAERSARQAEIDMVKNHVTELGEGIQAAFKSLDDVAKKADAVGNKIDSWNNKLDANQRLYDDIQKDIKKQEDRLSEKSKSIDKLEERQTQAHERTRNLHVAIYGNGTGSPKSLFQRQDDLEKMIREGQIEYKNLTIPMLELARSTAIRVDAIEQSIQKEKEVWQKRLKSARSVVKEAAKTPYFWFLLVFALLVIVALFRPEALADLIQLVQPLFSNTNP